MAIIAAFQAEDRSSNLRTRSNKYLKEIDMPPRNHKNWLATPKVEYISSEIYNNFSLFELFMYFLIAFSVSPLIIISFL